MRNGRRAATTTTITTTTMTTARMARMVAAIPKHQQKKMKIQAALILANVFFGAGAVWGALGLPATNPLVFALIRQLGAGGILMVLSCYFYRGQKQQQRQQPSRTTGSFTATSTSSTTTSMDTVDHSIPRLLVLLGATRRKMMLLPYALRAWTVHWKRFLLLGLMVFGNQVGFIVGIKLSGGPITASVWQPSQPIFTAAICMAWGWEPIQRKRVMGVAVAFLGCLAMVLLKTSSSSSSSSSLSNSSFTDGEAEEPATKTTGNVYNDNDNNDNEEDDPMDIHQSNNANTTTMAARYVMGNILFFVNCLCTSLYVILSKRMLAVYPPLLVTAWSYNGAAIFMFVTTLVAVWWPGANTFFCPECPEIQEDTSIIQRLFHVPSGAIPALLYYIIFASVSSYGLITWANQHATGTLVMSYTVLQPVTSTLLTTLLLALGVVASCHHQQVRHDGQSLSVVPTDACLDYPGLGTLCGMVGVFAGLALIVSTEPPSSSSDKKLVRTEDDDDLEKFMLSAKREEWSSAS